MESNDHLDDGDIKKTRNKKEKERKRPYFVYGEVFGSLSEQKPTTICQKYMNRNQKNSPDFTNDLTRN